MSSFNNIELDMNLGDAMVSLITELYPICRSITGDGVRTTLAQISKIIPIEINEVPTGTKVLDWEVPLEWNIKDAWIKNSSGDKIIDFNSCNLHVVNYSTPVHKKVDLKELKAHLHSNEEAPDLIPYRTSYHHRDWGFCMSHNQLQGLKDDTFEVMIDASLQDGHLSYGEFFIKGNSDEEVLISTHICHPSLANDNLSGVAVATYLAQILNANKKNLKYSFRFLFVPVTIGSITWLSLNEQNLDKIKHGLVLSLLGDKSKFHYKKTRNGNCDIDDIVAFCLDQRYDDYGILDFSPYGYDERQYCSPGYNLPVGRLSRALHGEFIEYHTSADNLNFIHKDKLTAALELLVQVVFVLENNSNYINQNPKGEPQLGRRGLFKSIGGQRETKDFQMALLWVLNLSDGTHSLLDIAKKANLNFELIVDAAKALFEVDLLK